MALLARLLKSREGEDVVLFRADGEKEMKKEKKKETKIVSQ